MSFLYNSLHQCDWIKGDSQCSVELESYFAIQRTVLAAVHSSSSVRSCGLAVTCQLHYSRLDIVCTVWSSSGFAPTPLVGVYGQLLTKRMFLCQPQYNEHSTLWLWDVLHTMNASLLSQCYHSYHSCNRCETLLWRSATNSTGSYKCSVTMHCATSGVLTLCWKACC